MERLPQGIVERVNNVYVGHCYEVGSSAEGTTLEEAFANLNDATWKVLQENGGRAAMLPNATSHPSADDVLIYQPSDSDPQSLALAAMTAVFLDGLGDFEHLSTEHGRR
jgi:hypothetical protein